MMTIELLEKLEAKLNEEIEASLDELVKAGRTGQDYRALLTSMEMLFYFSHNVQDEIEKIKNPPDNYSAQLVSLQDLPTSVMIESSSTKEEVPKEEPFRTPEPEPVGDGGGMAVLEDDLKKELTYEEVRAAVKAKAESGVPMQPIIEKFVPSGKAIKLSSVPKAKWDELLKELENA